MREIRTLKPNVSREAAILHFRPRGPVGIYRSIMHGPLRSVADVYVPFRVFRVQVRNGKQQQVQYLAIDAVSGTLDMYALDAAPRESSLATIATRNCPAPRLAEADARKILVDRVRKVIFQTGFFRVRNLEIEAELLPLELHVPYWIGFSGKTEAMYDEIAVLDAVRRRPEGAKVRELFREWLTA